MPRENRGPHLWQAASGIWFVRRFADGRRELRSTGCRNKQDAQAYFARALIAAERPDLPPEPSVADVLTAYATARAETHSAKNLARTCARVAAGMGWLRAGEVTAAHVRAYVARRRKASIGDGTIAEELNKLRSALRWAAGEGLMPQPRPWSVPVHGKPRERWLSREECDRLVAGAVEPHVRLFLVVALYTAMRPGAIFELPWSAVDLERRVIIPPAKERGKRRVPVPINDELLAALCEAQEHATTPWVIEYAGERVSTMRAGWRNALARSGIAHCTRHDLRRTAGSLMLQAGVPIELVSAVLGHRSIAITSAVYAHLAVEHLRPAVAALSRRE